jgi:5-methyltetrahydrofolate--homocysteine methyltransferase
MDSKLLDILSKRILVLDGATGTSFQSQNLSADDFGGEDYEGCNEYLVFSKPEAVEQVHRDFLEVGCDIIETNSFGSTSIVLAEYGLQDKAYELNVEAARIARRVADEYSTSDKPRFVAGSIGPTTKLPSLGHIESADMIASYKEEISGLMDGGVDILSIETCQDPLQFKCALAATQDVFDEKGLRIPVIVSLTIEAMGTMLMGTEIAAAMTTMEPFDIISIIGMNCATGPKEMEENLRYICENTNKPVMVMPNAGLPENIGGQTCYKLTPDEMEHWTESFIKDLGVNMIGGCCGTTPEHISRLVGLSERYTPRQRDAEVTPSSSSIYASVPMHLDPPPLLIGERCNANGSKKFRELLLEENYDAMVGMAKEQINEGAHILDVCVAYVGRDELRDMRELVSRFNTQISAPLMIDSTEVEVIEEALKLYSGKAIVNSINLEDGEGKLGRILGLCKRYGAAVVALTIDEDGMAKTAESKLAIAKRIRDLAVDTYGMKEEDIIFDTLTFTLGSGDEEYRNSAQETINSIKLIKQHYPSCYTSLGVSNVSFGLAPAARHVLNSVFLNEAIQAGLDMAIVHASKIIPLYKIDEQGRKLALDLVYDKRGWEEVV